MSESFDGQHAVNVIHQRLPVGVKATSSFVLRRSSIHCTGLLG